MVFCGFGLNLKVLSFLMYRDVTEEILIRLSRNPQNIFLNALWGLRRCIASASAAVAPPRSDNFREGNMIQSQSVGAVRGEQALSPP